MQLLYRRVIVSSYQQIPEGVVHRMAALEKRNERQQCCNAVQLDLRFPGTLHP